MTNPHDRNIFWETVLVWSLLSGICSTFIVVSILMKWRRDFSSRLIMQLSIADSGLSWICLCLCAYNFAHGHLQDQMSFVCRFQPFVTWYFMEVSMLWLAVISINSYKVVFYHEPLNLKQEIVATVVCWSIPFFTALLPLIPGSGQNYGPRNDLWCSFAESSKVAQFANLMIYYIPVCVVIIYCYARICVEIFTIVRNTSTKDSRNTDLQKKLPILRRMFLFVAAYFLVWSPMAGSYMYEYHTGKFINFGAEVVFDNFLHLQGVLNFLLYGMNSAIYKRFVKWISDRMDSLMGRSVDLSDLADVTDISMKSPSKSPSWELEPPSEC